MFNLGISCYYHDSAVALLEDGHVIAAVEEERFSRKKFDDDFPKMNGVLMKLGFLQTRFIQ